MGNSQDAFAEGGTLTCIRKDPRGTKTLVSQDQVARRIHSMGKIKGDWACITIC